MLVLDSFSAHITPDVLEGQLHPDSDDELDDPKPRPLCRTLTCNFESFVLSFTLYTLST